MLIGNSTGAAAFPSSLFQPGQTLASIMANEFAEASQGGLHMAALIGRHRDAVRVFLQRGGDDLVHRAVVPEVNHLGAHALQDAAHDVDGGIVPVKQASGSDKSHLVRGAVIGQSLEVSGQIGHGVAWFEPGKCSTFRLGSGRGARLLIDVTSIIALFVPLLLNPRSVTLSVMNAA